MSSGPLEQRAQAVGRLPLEARHDSGVGGGGEAVGGVAQPCLTPAAQLRRRSGVAIVPAGASCRSTEAPP